MILNLTAKKKRDTMAPNVNYPPATDGIRALTIQASPTATFIIWSPTQRQLREIFPTDKGSVPSGREETSCYIVGLKEKLSIATSSGVPWKWRRIVFTHKGELPLGEQFEGPRTYSTITDAIGRDTYYRTMSPLPTNSVVPLVEYIFRGDGNTTLGLADWTDVMTAPMDTTRIKVMNDGVTHIRSGNQSGVLKTYNRWHPVRKNLVYGDEEIGNQVLSSAYSTQGRPGIGDIYVLDIFTSLSDSTSDTLSITTTATQYWHER